MTNKSKLEIFEYLDNLRESGVTNMFGAAPYIAEEFDLEKREARVILAEWMRSFSNRHPQMSHTSTSG